MHHKHIYFNLETQTRNLTFNGFSSIILPYSSDNVMYISQPILHHSPRIRKNIYIEITRGNMQDQVKWNANKHHLSFPIPKLFLSNFNFLLILFSPSFVSFTFTFPLIFYINLLIFKLNLVIESYNHYLYNNHLRSQKHS